MVFCCAYSTVLSCSEMSPSFKKAAQKIRPTFQQERIGGGGGTILLTTSSENATINSAAGPITNPALPRARTHQADTGGSTTIIARLVIRGKCQRAVAA